ncbi:hypothetical protein [Arthrobacter sp. MMS18-M83]|uniref:hypothetical protein n=1 Tax=Arthrobacter sp. MMS18-M83 TaxID=2996261 RepID=UPI00227A3E67|nr:hypothetical protein [Arthrobacter sp. MMS18-M83]WAH97732.1 hypothetical protein OW521_02190 [Arthrobacter sp. MMS18-M83]
MMNFDASLTYTSYEPHMHKAQNERQRRQLDAVVLHAKGEVLADLSLVIPSLCADPQYHEYGVFANVLGDTGPKGMEAVVANYEHMVESGSYVIESIKDRLMISDDEIMSDGSYRQILTSAVAKELGFVAEDDESSRHYMLSGRTVVFWKFDDEEKALGEDRYVVDRRIEPLDAEDLPADYPDRLR